MENKVYLATEVDFTIQEVQERAEPRNLLMATPDYFDIVDVKNVHMEGNAGKLSKQKAKSDWQDLRMTFEQQIPHVLDKVYVIPGAENCEDMVFTANQSFPWVNEAGKKIVIMSKMRHASRQREVPHFAAFYSTKGYEIIELKDTKMFEGMGDLIPHTGKKLLYGGYGHRTTIDAYSEISKYIDAPIIALELIDERFYHLDTCFVSLTPEAVMICKEAFTREGMKVLEKMYKRVHCIPIDEAIDFFALNAHAMYNQATGYKSVVIQAGSTYTLGILKKEGFDVFEVDTTEYMKSGGSVFCMKMMFY